MTDLIVRETARVARCALRQGVQRQSTHEDLRLHPLLTQRVHLGLQSPHHTRRKRLVHVPDECRLYARLGAHAKVGRIGDVAGIVRVFEDEGATGRAKEGKDTY